VIVISPTNIDSEHSKEEDLLDDDPDFVLYTTASHEGEWLIDLIDAALWLPKIHCAERNSDHKPAHVKILLLPVGYYQMNPLTGLLILSIKKFLFGLPDIMKNRLPSKLKSYSKQSFYNRIYSGKKVQLQHGETILTFTLFNTISLKYVHLFLSSYIRSIFLWPEYYQGRHFEVQKFLNLHFQHIHIGDCIASTTLREKPQLAGSLRPCRELFHNLTDAICICNLCNKLPKNGSKPTYVMVPEPTYLHFIYARALHSAGANIIEAGFSYYKKFDITKPGQKYISPWFVRPRSNKPNIDEISQIRNYLQKRIFESDEKLWYMYIGQNDNTSTDILDICGNKIDLDDKNLYAVIFLHSFEDGQYFYGLDGFDDLYHWTTFTIDQCLKNSSINTIFIKQHPNVDYISFPADKLAFENLLQRYTSNERVVFIDKSSSLVHLTKSVRLFGITHHGSVAEELVYLHQPVIASTAAPWQSHYSFVRTWKNPKKYEILLDSLSIETWSAPSESEINSLYTYVQEYRLNDYQRMFPYQKTAEWVNFLKLYSGKTSLELNQENHIKFEEIFQTIAGEDPVFREFIDFLMVSQDRLRSHCSNST
jgi:hypothetical protein